MKKLLLICPVIAALIFVGGSCTMEDAGEVTVSNTAVEKTTIKLDNTMYEAGGDITVTLNVAATENLADTAWVGVIPSDVVHGDEKINDEYDSDYEYVSNAVNDQLSLVAPSEMGEYDVRLFSSDTSLAEEITYVSFDVN